jgi:MYXO-CTERM domain-containing protein
VEQRTALTHFQKSLSLSNRSDLSRNGLDAQGGTAMNSAKCLSRTGQPHRLLTWLVAGLGLFAARNALATEYYVAPTGSDSNPGTQASPFATLQKGADTAAAGDTVWIRGGTYKITTPKNSGAGIELSPSGTSDTNRIKYWAYPGETPLFDFSNLQIQNGAYTFGIVIGGSWVHLKGIEECCVPMNTKANNGFANNGSNNILELLNAHNNQGSGIQVGSGSGNLALNCDSHDNFDPGSTNGGGAGEDADGFGVHGGSGTVGTTIRGCRAWWNSDDGYDFLSDESPVLIENSWAMGAGYSNYGTGAGGNGNGFKVGSSKTGIRHTVTNCVAWKNKANGFYANHSSGGNTWYNNTSFQNGTQYNMLASTWSEPNGGGTRTDGVILTGTKVHIMRNNIGYPNKNEYITGYGVDTAFNTWDLNITPKATDFLSITDATVSGTGQTVETTSLALGPRQADGSLPNVDFLKLAAGSQMIDKGTDVKLPFVGAAPDLGAYEFGASGAAGGGGTGGVTGSGGTTEAGGGTGSSGSTGRGGDTGTGGRPTLGGATEIGGNSASGGTPVVGGTPAVGSTAVTGGKTGSSGGAGVVASASTVGTGGSIGATGGSVATGGATSEFSASGGAASTSSVPSGGTPITGGTAGTGAPGSTTSASATAQTSSGGCSCRIAGAHTRSYPGFALLALLVFALRTRKKR